MLHQDFLAVLNYFHSFFFLHLSETALKLDTLVGDIEDAMSSSLNKNRRKHSSKQRSEVHDFIYYQLQICSECSLFNCYFSYLQEMHLIAIETRGQTENVLTFITKTHPQWTCLVSAVDHRVDRALAI